MKDKKNRYILITKDLQKNLIEFLDEVQLEAAKLNTNENMHIVNFCSFAIEELLSGLDAKFNDKKPPQKKSRDQYLDETFMDWNLPEMDDEEYEKFVNQVDGFLRAWEKGYKKKNKEDKDQMDIDFEPVQDREFKPRLEDVVEHCSLEEIEDMLKDDPELTKEDRFDLYYEEHERVNRKKKKTYTLNQMLKGNKLTRYKEPPKK
tara:strand:- start:633 stop:1244 length:612 start_codon:yes stop_codon:yes gene_type:complete